MLDRTYIRSKSTIYQRVADDAPSQFFANYHSGVNRYAAFELVMLLVIGTLFLLPIITTDTAWFRWLSRGKT